MSEYEPITAELRAAMNVDREYTMGGDVVARTYCMGRDEFADRCDAIDAVHAALERENAELRQRVAVLDNERGNMHETDAWKLGYDEGFASADDWMSDNEDAMEEHGWMRMPLDADGEYIRIGDVMEWVRYEDDDPTIVRNVAAVGADVFFAWSDEQGRYAQYEAHAYRHHHAPTVEDVLREMADRCYADEDEPRDRDAIVAEYAAKLRLAGDAS